MVAWNQGLARPKFSFQNFSSSPTQSYTITSSWGLLLIGLSLDFTVIGSSIVFSLTGFSLESSVISFPSESAGIDSSLGSSMLFFRNQADFYQIVLLLFITKKEVLFYIIFPKRSSYLTISLTRLNNCNKTHGEKIKKYLHDRDTKHYIKKICHHLITRFINYPYSWIYSSYILDKKLNKILQEPN